MRRIQYLRKFVADAVDFVFEGAVVSHLAFDYIDGREDRGMISSEYFCRILQRQVGDISDHIDGNVAGKSNFRRSFFALDIFNGNVVTL